MERKKLITILQGLLDTQEELDFLLGLTVKDLDKMAGIVRESSGLKFILLLVYLNNKYLKLKKLSQISRRASSFHS